MYEESINDYEMSLKIKPAVETLYNCGSIYFEIKKYDLAIACFTRALEIRPNDLEFIISRGQSYEKQKNYDKAFENYDAALQLDPNNVRALSWSVVLAHIPIRDVLLTFTCSRGLAYLHTKRYDEALVDFTRGIELDASNIRSYNNRGNTWAHKKDFEAAIRDYSAAIALNGQYVKAIKNRHVELSLLN